MDKGIPLRDGCPPDAQPVDGAGRTEPGGVSRTIGASRLGALSARAGVVARGDPVILEGTFGWAWMAQELQACGLEPHLCNGRKVDRWREAKGLAKTNRIDANLIRELWAESTRWWEVWLAPLAPGEASGDRGPGAFCQPQEAGGVCLVGPAGPGPWGGDGGDAGGAACGAPGVPDAEVGVPGGGARGGAEECVDGGGVRPADGWGSAGQESGLPRGGPAFMRDRLRVST